MTCLQVIDFPTMKLVHLQLHNKFGSVTVYHSWVAHVKEMYNWLPQQDFRKAIKWVLKYVERKPRRSHVAVFYKKSKKNRLGKSYNTDTLISISFQMIFIISCFQLKNAYFHLTGRVFLHTILIT